MVKYDENVWGPHFWFVLHSVSLTYPPHPNAITKRKYYDFIMNLPLFLPNEKMGNKLFELFNTYPAQPYLDNPDSFYRWTWFIHNKINKQLNKPEISIEESLEMYFTHYQPKSTSLSETLKIKKGLLYALFVVFFMVIIYISYSH